MAVAVLADVAVQGAYGRVEHRHSIGMLGRVGDEDDREVREHAHRAERVARGAAEQAEARRARLRLGAEVSGGATCHCRAPPLPVALADTQAHELGHDGVPLPCDRGEGEEARRGRVREHPVQVLVGEAPGRVHAVPRSLGQGRRVGSRKRARGSGAAKKYCNIPPLPMRQIIL